MTPDTINTPPDDIEGPRACGPYELASVLDLVNLVHRTLWAEPGGAVPRPTIGFDYPHVYATTNLDNIRVFTHRGRVVSSVGIYPNTVRTPLGEVSVGGISTLATHPDYRRYGLGTQVMEDAHRKMMEDGHHIGLLTTRVHDFYRKLGWESAGRQLSFTFDRGNIDVLGDAGDLEVAEDWISIVDALNDLHLGEPVTSLRDPAAFRLLMERKARRIFVGLRNGKGAAYTAVRGTSVVEHAGALDDVIALLRCVFAELDDPKVATSERPPGKRATIEMQVTAPDADDGLAGLLMSKGVPHSLDYLGMIRVLDPVGLFEALGVGGTDVQASDDGWRLTWDEHSRNFSARDLARLIFGPERIAPPTPEGLPIAFYQWTADLV
ncbi:MAG: GNAT family N-acetyltransferase [Candidatus Latescibacteria bacterium]|jgi:ribosomal protein S18 acetylase RimI-like enzyme|nr:GNAT family N-acetyltransferase [Candidatus Latescibacterota bacterium]